MHEIDIYAIIGIVGMAVMGSLAYVTMYRKK